MGIRFLCLIISLCFFGFLSDVIKIKLIEREAKKHNYNCDKCGIYDCPYKDCRKYKKEGI